MRNEVLLAYLKEHHPRELEEYDKAYGEWTKAREECIKINEKRTRARGEWDKIREDRTKTHEELAKASGEWDKANEEYAKAYEEWDKAHEEWVKARDKFTTFLKKLALEKGWDYERIDFDSLLEGASSS